MRKKARFATLYEKCKRFDLKKWCYSVLTVDWWYVTQYNKR